MPTDAADMAGYLTGVEAEMGARLGFVCRETGSGRLTTYCADERFPIMSTFKLLLAGAFQGRIDAGTETADRQVSIPATDLTGHCPITSAHVGRALGVEELCAAAVRFSDNAAADLLLAGLGGPEGLTAGHRRSGDAAGPVRA